MNMKSKIDFLLQEAEASLAQATSRELLEDFRIRFLARKGSIASLFDEMKGIAAEERPSVGRLLNTLRSHVQSAFDQKINTLQEGDRDDHSIDLTLPGRSRFVGTKHPITQTADEIKSIFVSMGFGIADGPEIEDDYHNFEALNFPPHHPARDAQDTYFLNDNLLLRTHTTPVQIRVMEEHQPPVRIIMPGKVYRNEAISARSYCVFHQVDGLYVDEGVTFSELKGTMISFIKRFYGSSVRYKFRPTFFPFTEPSADIYISCFLCGGKGCKLCKQNGWLEILGCGMVDPNVFLSVGYDEEKYTGFAFGMGIERIALLRYGIDDIRLLYENDVRFLNQF